MFDINELITNETLENDGVWKVIGRDKDGNKAEVKIARMGNKAYRQEMRRAYRANRATLEQDDDYAADLNDELTLKVMSKTILMDVRGIQIDGKPIEKYTPEVGEQLLKIRNFAEKVKDIADESENYRDKQEANEVK